MCTCFANHPSNKGKRTHEMTDLKIQKFIRKPFPVEGVRVTKDNMEKVAKWSNGEVRTSAKGVKHIFIDVHRPMTERQTMAFVGDWILFADRGFKIYTQNAFSRNFELVKAGTGADHADFVAAEEDTPLEGVDFEGETKLKLPKGMQVGTRKPKVPKKREEPLPAEGITEAVRKLNEHFHEGDPSRP